MAFYELAANAAKHGTLSTSHVDVSWKFSGESVVGRRLRFTWQEQDSPAVESEIQASGIRFWKS